MTNRIAIVLALLIVGLFVADHLWLKADLGLFLTQQVAALVEWFSFWR